MGKIKNGLIKLITRVKESKILLVGIITLAAIGAVGGYKTYDYAMNDPTFCTSCHLMDTPYKKWSQSVHSQVNCHECHKTSINDVKRIYEVLLIKPEEVLPHSKVNPGVCLTCHAHQQEEWPAIQDTAGHKVHYVEKGFSCTDCHVKSIHKFVPPTDICLKCHEKTIKIEGMKGFHCLNCHQFKATKKELRPDREACLECHKTIKGITTTRVTFPKTAHSNSLCSTCHQPHEDRRPASCTAIGCHEVQTGGIHDVPSHKQECTKCHTQHNSDPRKTCLACHTDKKEHNSPSGCNLCHNKNQVKP
jgi:nitrate/TMAO reductase-like tetraheme cytochrome c subunit